MIVFEDDDYYTGPALSPELISRAQDSLGVILPRDYLNLLRQRNGGIPRSRRVPTTFETSWAQDHFEILAILGIGGERGVDSTGGWGSRDQIAEWGYPDIGIVVCDMPSGGHDVVMLDYSVSGETHDPAVVYVDEDRVVRTIARSFGEFLEKLVP